MELVIKAREVSGILAFFGRHCGDLFPESVAVDARTGSDPEIVTFEKGVAVKFIPDPTVDVYVELPLDIIALASVERRLSDVEQSILNMMMEMDKFTMEQRAEVTALRRIALAESRPFSIKVLQVPKYLAPRS